MAGPERCRETNIGDNMTAKERRERILNANDIQSEMVSVPEWDTELKIVGMTGEERARWLQAAMETSKDGTVKTNLEKIYPDLLITCARDPETGEKVFEVSDRDALNQKSGAILERIAQIAVKISGLNPDAMEIAKKNSSTVNGEPTSELPKTSIGPQ